VDVDSNINRKTLHINWCVDLCLGIPTGQSLVDEPWMSLYPVYLVGTEHALPRGRKDR